MPKTGKHKKWETSVLKKIPLLYVLFFFPRLLPPAVGNGTLQQEHWPCRHVLAAEGRALRPRDRVDGHGWIKDDVR
eukprot:1839653-Amphidinium_carterae.1